MHVTWEHKPSTLFWRRHMVRKLWSSSDQCATAGSDILTSTLSPLYDDDGRGTEHLMWTPALSVGCETTQAQAQLRQTSNWNQPADDGDLRCGKLYLTAHPGYLHVCTCVQMYAQFACRHVDAEQVHKETALTSSTAPDSYSCPNLSLRGRVNLK